MTGNKTKYPRKVYVSALSNVLVIVFLLLVHMWLVGQMKVLYSTAFVSFETLLAICLIGFVYRDLKQFPSREETKVFVVMFGILSTLMIIEGVLILYLSREEGGRVMYMFLVPMPALLSVIVASFDQSDREKVASTVHYGCSQPVHGRYYIFLFYQWIVYFCAPLVVFMAYRTSSNIALLLLITYMAFTVLFITRDYNNRKNRGKSFFWKSPT